jgi:hypothetical protein
MILYPLLETRGGQFTCGVAGAVMKRDEAANGMSERRGSGEGARGTLRYFVDCLEIARASSRPRGNLAAPLRAAPRRASYGSPYVYNRAARIGTV